MVIMKFPQAAGVSFSNGHEVIVFGLINLTTVQFLLTSPVQSIADLYPISGFIGALASVLTVFLVTGKTGGRDRPLLFIGITAFSASVLAPLILLVLAGPITASDAGRSSLGEGAPYGIEMGIFVWALWALWLTARKGPPG